MTAELKLWLSVFRVPQTQNFGRSSCEPWRGHAVSSGGPQARLVQGHDLQLRQQHLGHQLPHVATIYAAQRESAVQI